MEPPKKKMPVTRALLMSATALLFSIIILFFSTLPFTAPFIVGAGVASTVSNYTNKTIAGAVGTVAGAITGTLEIFTGTDVAIDIAGEIVAGVISFVAWGIFYIWFLVAGIKLMGSRRAVRRFFISGGSTIAGMIPIINIIPSVLIGVLLNVWQTRKEDKETEKEYEEFLHSQSNQRPSVRLS